MTRLAPTLLTIWAPTARTPATQTARSPRRGDDIDRVVIQTGALGGALQLPRAMLSGRRAGRFLPGLS